MNDPRASEIETEFIFRNGLTYQDGSQTRFEGAELTINDRLLNLDVGMSYSLEDDIKHGGVHINSGDYVITEKYGNIQPGKASSDPHFISHTYILFPVTYVQSHRDDFSEMALRYLQKA